MSEDKELAELAEQVGGYLKRRINRRQAIKVGGLAAAGLILSKPLLSTIRPTPAFADYLFGVDPDPEKRYCSYEIISASPECPPFLKVGVACCPPIVCGTAEQPGSCEDLVELTTCENGNGCIVKLRRCSDDCLNCGEAGTPLKDQPRCANQLSLLIPISDPTDPDPPPGSFKCDPVFK